MLFTHQPITAGSSLRQMIGKDKERYL